MVDIWGWWGRVGGVVGGGGVGATYDWNGCTDGVAGLLLSS